jgi:hypothetical protein
MTQHTQIIIKLHPCVEDVFFGFATTYSGVSIDVHQEYWMDGLLNSSQCLKFLARRKEKRKQEIKYKEGRKRN